MGKIVRNRFRMEFMSLGENVALARITIAALASQMEMTLNDLEEIKVAASEAVSNAIIHGYENRPDGLVSITATLSEDSLTVEIEDHGIGIPDIQQAMQPAYSTDPERMGLGFVFMKSFMDTVEVVSEVNRGTKVTLVKQLSGQVVSNQAVS